MSVFSVNHKKLKNAIFFNAFYSAIIFGISFIVNDYIDLYIIPHLEKNFYLKSSNKLFLHVFAVFIITYVVVYMLWFFFGWGKSLRET